MFALTVYVKHFLYLLLVLISCGLVSCQGEQPNQTSVVPASLKRQSLDSLTNAFLVHAHDSVETPSDTLVSQLTRVLQQQGVDTLLYYSSGCTGCDILLEEGEIDCACTTTEQESYLYWQQAGETFVKKLDCCRNHPAVATTAEAFTFYFQHQEDFQARTQFYRDLAQYNQTHPGKLRFLPSGPIHDLEVSYLLLRVGKQQQEIYVRGGEYDSVGTPLFLDYAWRRTQWKWTKLLKTLPTKEDKRVR